MNMREETVSSEEIFTGRVITLKREIVRLPNGREASREVVMHPGGVAIVPLDGEGNVYVVRQYRRPLDDVIMEIPAGKLNWGEEHCSCGVRELAEETGMTAGRLDYLGKYYPTPGFCQEIIHIYLARDLKKGEMHPDEDEFLEVERLPLDTLLDMVMNNEILDAKTAIGILKTAELLRREEKGLSSSENR